jgi:hypothetical protein
MPDITMCSSERCERATACRRHAGSGTVANQFRQSISDFSFNKWWGAESCFGFLPVNPQPDDLDDAR